MGRLSDHIKKRREEAYRKSKQYIKDMLKKQSIEKSLHEAKVRQEKESRIRRKIEPITDFINECFRDMEHLFKESKKGSVRFSPAFPEIDLENQIVEFTAEYTDVSFRHRDVHRKTGFWPFSSGPKVGYTKYTYTTKRRYSFTWEYDLNSKMLIHNNFSTLIDPEKIEESEEKILDYFMLISKRDFKKSTKRESEKSNQSYSSGTDFSG